MATKGSSITTTRVTFGVDGDSVVGLLRVLRGPLTSVEEQVPGHHAEALARRGFVTLAIDNR